MAVNATHNKTIMVVTPFGRYSKVFIADMQILGSAFCFGIGFLGQRAVMVRHPVVDLLRRRGAVDSSRLIHPFHHHHLLL